MLRVNGSDQWIDDDQVGDMRPLLDQFWNKSISWTSTEGSWTKLSFVGTDVWAYGIAGPKYGSLRINLDSQDSEVYTQTQDSEDCHKLLFEAHGLEDKEHTLTLTNLGIVENDTDSVRTSTSTSTDGRGAGGGGGQERDRNGRLGFDYAVIQSEAFWMGSSIASSSSTDAPKSATTQDSQPSSSAIPTSTEGTAALAAQAGADASAASASASAAAAMAALLPTQYSASQLASLKTPYTFKWNPAAYFVVVFTSVIVLLAGVYGLHLLVKRWAIHKTGGAFRQRDRRLGEPSNSRDAHNLAGVIPPSNQAAGRLDSDVESGRKREKKRPATRVLQALSSRKIGLPFERQRAEAHQAQDGRESGQSSFSSCHSRV
ncbi:hypothetical protein IAU59_003754 [Kwoniella sp. CBS 9459]